MVEYRMLDYIIQLGKIIKRLKKSPLKICIYLVIIIILILGYVFIKPYLEEKARRFAQGKIEDQKIISYGQSGGITAQKVDISNINISHPNQEDLVLQLADKSMMNRKIMEWDVWDGGDAVSFDKLVEIANDKHNLKLSEFAQKQIDRVNQSYSDSDILVRRIRLDDKDKNAQWIHNEAITTEHLIGFLHSQQNVLKTYSRAAQLLEDRKNKKVLDELVYVMKNNPSLLVRKIALDSFTKLAKPLGFNRKENDLLDFNSPIVFWETNKNKEEIIKKLENQN